MAGELFQSQGASYATKLDAAASEMYAKWWQSLSKEELLAYLADQPTVTADNLRQMLSNEQATLNIGTAFSVATMNAVTDFHTVEN